MKVGKDGFAVFTIVFLLTSTLLVQTVAANPSQINIDLSKEYQTMDGVGGNFYVWFYDSSKYATQKLVDHLRNFPLTHARIRSEIMFAERYQNDDNDPYHINPAGFDWNNKMMKYETYLLKELKNNNIEPILTVFFPPEWMMDNPNHVNPYYYPELGELISAYLLHFKDEGILINTVCIANEPNVGDGVYYSEQELVEATEAIQDVLEHFNLDYVKLIVGDTDNPIDAIPYSTNLLQNQGIADQSEAVSYHTYNHYTISELQEFKNQVMDTFGIKSWATEVGTSTLNTHTFDWAFKCMQRHIWAMKYASSSMTFQWTVIGPDGCFNLYTGEPYPVSYAIRHIYEHLSPGMIRVDIDGEESSFSTIAFKDINEKKLLIVVVDLDSYGCNTKFKLSASNVKYKNPQAFLTSESPEHLYEETTPPTLNSDNSFTYYIPGKSIHTFLFNYNSLPSGTMRKVPSSDPQCDKYIFSFDDADGLSDIQLAGAGIFHAGKILTFIPYNDPNPPSWYKASIGNENLLTIEMDKIPKRLNGIIPFGLFIDKDGESVILWLH